jgi:transcription antitermination factor NusG
MESLNKWFVVYTKPKRERKVSKLLNSKKVENYYPVNRIVHNWPEKRKICYEPLFASFIFVHVSKEELSKVIMTDGVISYVYWLNEPAEIGNSEIFALRSFVNDHWNIKLKRVDINVNKDESITNNSYKTTEKSIMNIYYNNVTIVLPSLGYSLTAPIHKTQIEKVQNIQEESYHLGMRSAINYF